MNFWSPNDNQDENWISKSENPMGLLLLKHWSFRGKSSQATSQLASYYWNVVLTSFAYVFWTRATGAYITNCISSSPNLFSQPQISCYPWVCLQPFLKQTLYVCPCVKKNPPTLLQVTFVRSWRKWLKLPKSRRFMTKLSALAFITLLYFTSVCTSSLVSKQVSLLSKSSFSPIAQLKLVASSSP